MRLLGKRPRLAGKMDYFLILIQFPRRFHGVQPFQVSPTLGQTVIRTVHILLVFFSFFASRISSSPRVTPMMSTRLYTVLMIAACWANHTFILSSFRLMPAMTAKRMAFCYILKKTIARLAYSNLCSIPNVNSLTDGTNHKPEEWSYLHVDHGNYLITCVR